MAGKMIPLTLSSGHCQAPLRPGNVDKKTADIFLNVVIVMLQLL